MRALVSQLATFNRSFKSNTDAITTTLNRAKEVYKSQADVIEQFLFEIIDTAEYKAVEYLAFSIYKPMLEYFMSLRTRENTFPTPPFLIPLGNRVGELFCEKG